MGSSWVEKFKWKGSSGLLMVCVYQRTILVLCTGSSGCLHCWVERGGEREPFFET